MSAAEIEATLLQTLGKDGAVADSADFAAAHGWDHLAVVGVIKSLEAAEMLVTQVRRRSSAPAAAAASRALAPCA
jgi:hypothetical protein